MSAIFLSHSSVDHEAAARAKAVLAEHGHGGVFLDFDPEHGIPAGRRWEAELYAQLRSCQAVVVLCSANSMRSSWCFAEITHARALGKVLFPVKISDCTISSLLGDVQTIDLTLDPAAGWQRLITGLRAAGLDPAAWSDWDPARPPYPGLLAFEPRDAAVYFGREGPLRELLDTLNRVRHLGGARLVLVLGASGSGKSSLVRAGMVPRLARSSESWRVAPPLRPGARPLDALAVALATLPGAGPWQAVRERIEAGRWHELLNDTATAGGNDAAVLVIVDQFEEALTTAGDEPTRFLRQLAQAVGGADERLYVVATLRSDFLAAFQTHPALQGVRYEALPLPQIDLGAMAAVIEGPARVAGFDLGPGLVQALVSDTATDDALPLLAFTLRELYDRHEAELRRGQALTLEHYRQLGGLQGSVARAADAVVRPVGTDAPALDALRRALLRLVRIDNEGRFVRQPRRWQDMPAAAHAALESFVQARLLVSRPDADGGRTIEVAHEALFRSWGRLGEWLAADRDFLLWHERLRSASSQWQGHGGDSGLLLRGTLLDEARRWFDARASDLDTEGRDFIAASIAAREAAERRRRRRLQLAVGSLMAAVLVFGVLSAVALLQSREAGAQRRLAQARQLNTLAELAQHGDPVLSLIYTVRSLKTAPTPEAHAAMFDRLDAVVRPQPSRWKPHPGTVRAMTYDFHGGWLATAGPRGVQVQTAGGGVHALASDNHHEFLHALAFSPGGEWLAATCGAQLVCIHGSGRWAEPPRRLAVAGDSPVSALAVSSDGKMLAVGLHTSGEVRLFAMPSGDPLLPIRTNGSGIVALAFKERTAHLVLATREQIEVWTLPGRKIAGSFASRRITGAIAFSTGGRYLAVRSNPFRMLEWVGSDNGQVELRVVAESTIPAASSMFGQTALVGKVLHTASTDEARGVWVQSRQAELALAPGTATTVLFDGANHMIVGDHDGGISDWDLDDRPLRRVAAHAQPRVFALDADGRRLAIGGEDGMVRIVDTTSGRELRAWQRTDATVALAFSADGHWLAAIDDKAFWLSDTADGHTIGPFEHEGTITSLRFEDGGKRLATTTRWGGADRAAITRPTRLRVWDTATRAELGWRFDIAGDLERAHSGFTRESLARFQVTEGGDVAWVAKASGWPLAFVTNHVNHEPAPDQLTPAVLTAATAAGRTLAAAALDRARPPNQMSSAHAFSADGRLLVSAGDGEARLWPLRVDDLVADACGRLTRDLSCAEWRAAFGTEPYQATCPRPPAAGGAVRCPAEGEVPR